MESVASTSSPLDNHQFNNPTQPLQDRIVRAISHHLRLLHRSNSTFFILGATANVYTVTLSDTPSCTCPDRTTPCKHILFVYIRVLGLSLDDTCLWRKTLRPCQLGRLLGLPTLNEALATSSVRDRFHELFFRPKQEKSTIEIQDGSICPVCLEEMRGGEKVVACGTCRNPIHEECLLAWKRSNSRRRSVSCVICRARWRDRPDEETYLNLSAYVSEDDMVEGDGYCDG